MIFISQPCGGRTLQVYLIPQECAGNAGFLRYTRFLAAGPARVPFEASTAQIPAAGTRTGCIRRIWDGGDGT